MLVNQGGLLSCGVVAQVGHNHPSWDCLESRGPYRVRNIIYQWLHDWWWQWLIDTPWNKSKVNEPPCNDELWDPFTVDLVLSRDHQLPFQSIIIHISCDHLSLIIFYVCMKPLLQQTQNVGLGSKNLLFGNRFLLSQLSPAFNKASPTWPLWCHVLSWIGPKGSIKAFIVLRVFSPNAKFVWVACWQLLQKYVLPLPKTTPRLQDHDTWIFCGSERHSRNLFARPHIQDSFHIKKIIGPS